MIRKRRNQLGHGLLLYVIVGILCVVAMLLMITTQWTMPMFWTWIGLFIVFMLIGKYMKVHDRYIFNKTLAKYLGASKSFQNKIDETIEILKDE